MKKIKTVGEGVPYDLRDIKLKVNEIVILLNNLLFEPEIGGDDDKWHCEERSDNKTEQFTKEELEYIRAELEHLLESFPTVMFYEHRILNRGIREKIGRLLNSEKE